MAAIFAFAANELSPRGLNLARDYFPRVASPTHLPPQVTPLATAQPASTIEDSATAEISQRIKQKGLQPLDRAQTERLFHDPRYLQGWVIFIDARSEDLYAQSHIPGAYQLDHYHLKNLAADLTPCQMAETVVVYCGGGECEDAEYTAGDLRDAGIASQKLFVYGGGFEDWSKHHLPLEQGERNSGLAPPESK
jgi:rhodanese-related sulfurtransferase